MGRYKSKFNGQQIDNGIEYGVRVTQQTFSSAQKQQARGNIAAQETVTDLKAFGCAYGLCDTASTTAAKTVAITNFILLPNAIVGVRFQHGINVANATLNINNQGAYPIMLGGVNLPVGIIPTNTTCTLQYVSNQWNIIGIAAGTSSEDELLVDLGLPSGLLWATRNLDVTQPSKFAASPYQYGCSFFSWGNIDGHNPHDTSHFDYAFSSADYALTQGSSLTADFSLTYDAAHANLGGDWRMPTINDFTELLNNTEFIAADGTIIDSSQTNKMVTVDGVQGIYLKSKLNNRTIFFPCSGYGGDGTWNRATNGHYWSTVYLNATNGGRFNFTANGITTTGSPRYLGMTIRPVQ